MNLEQKEVMEKGIKDQKGLVKHWEEECDAYYQKMKHMEACLRHAQRQCKEAELKLSNLQNNTQ